MKTEVDEEEPLHVEVVDDSFAVEAPHEVEEHYEEVLMADVVVFDGAEEAYHVTEEVEDTVDTQHAALEEELDQDGTVSYRGNLDCRNAAAVATCVEAGHDIHEEVEEDIHAEADH